MKREDIYTLDEELPKRVKARFVSANDNCYLGTPNEVPILSMLSQFQKKSTFGFWLILKNA